VTLDQLFAENGIGIKNKGDGRYYATCPKCSNGRKKAHQNNRVLGVTIKDGSAMWGCNHCGWTGPEKRANGHADLITYDYCAPSGEAAFQKVRGYKNGGKFFWLRRPDGHGDWINGISGVNTKIIYRLPEISEAISNGYLIAVVEGEKDADNLWRIGIPATCNAYGASEPDNEPKWRAEHSEQLRGADLVVFNDNDAAGIAHADAVSRLSFGIAGRVRRLDLAKHWPDMPANADVSDWLARGHNREELDDLIKAAPDFEYQAEPATANGHDKDRFPKNRKPQDRVVQTQAFTDDALALTFADNLHDRLRYVAKMGQWFSWDETRWRSDDTLLARDHAREICRSASNECNDPKVGKTIASGRVISATERLAQSDRRLAATVDQFDADAWVLNTPSGIVDLRSGQVRPHDQLAYLTKITTVAPDPAGDITTWRSFLDRITDGNQELVDYLQRTVGYSLTGSTQEHALFFLFGTGANGKTTFLNAVTGALGDYHRTAPIETFTDSKNDRHPTELAMLRGARLVTAIETEEGRRWAESRIKQLTGGDRVAARFVRQDFFEFTPAFKLMIAGNNKPGLRSVDEAIRRRLNLIPFVVTIPAAERDPELGEKLQAEAAGILAWAVQGCAGWQERGLAPPKVVTDATAAYLEAEDAVSAWLDDKCERDPQAFTNTTDLFASWSEWATQSGEFVGSVKRFVSALETRGFPQHRRRDGRGFTGLRVKQTWSSRYEP
jgi:putative DNA primase/helicase